MPPEDRADHQTDPQREQAAHHQQATPSPIPREVGRDVRRRLDGLRHGVTGHAHRRQQSDDDQHREGDARQQPTNPRFR
ncbi:MAG TPA: hypothetical protein VFM74_00810 [Candidatus Limnocylindria bacterium]|nr:hypothetical protein [Candidatus Limnocylindria bacterium]